MSIETTTRTAGLDDEEKKHCYWACDQIMELDKAVKNVITVRGENFRNELLSLSKLKSGSTFYMLLQEVLVRFLQFEKEPTTKSSNHRCCKKTAEKEDKLPAVVAGSYLAFLANAVKQHGDVDVFVMVKDSTIKVFNTLWKFLQQQEADDDNGELLANNALFHGGGDGGYQTSFRDILAVVNFGDVQLIFRYYNCECECDYHVDKNFFKDFHHCTRWKLDVFKDCKVPRYIHLEDGAAGEIICKETSLTLQYEKVVILTWEGVFESKTYPKKYPNKHADNVVDFGPPKLKQQALHHILRRRRRKEQQQQQQTNATSCCSRKRKWEEAADLLMCSEQMSIDDDDDE